MSNNKVTSIQQNANPAIDFFNKLFNSSIIKTEEVNLEYLEGEVLSYNKAYKTLLNITTTTSSTANNSWDLYDNTRDISLNTYVSTNVQSDNIPVVDFWLQYEDGSEEAHTITKEVPMRPGHHLRLNYLTVDGSSFYMYDVENLDTRSTNVLISDYDLKGFVIHATRKTFSFAVGATVGLLFLVTTPLFAVLGAVGGFYLSNRYMLNRNVRVLKNRIYEIKQGR